MEKNRYSAAENIVSVLCTPKMFILLFWAWVAVVLIGSGIAIGVTKMSLLSNSEVENILSENERLALYSNVVYEEGHDGYPSQTTVGETAAILPDRLIIPKIGTDLQVSNPESRNITVLDEALKTAAVRYPDSATLGQLGGNTLLFGHSSRLPIVHNKLYKAFNDIETLSIGDTIQVMSGGDVYTYHVSRVYQASAKDDRIPLAVEGHRLTLLTCDSFGSKSDRWVVEADYIGKNI